MDMEEKERKIAELHEKLRQ